MNIQILDSWLREYLDTKATAKQISEKLSLTSVSVERLEKRGTDFLYDIEVTTNRPDLMSVIGLAREAAAILPHHGAPATFKKQNFKIEKTNIENPEKIEIKNDPKLVNRICAVVMDVKIGESPKFIIDRLEATGIRSLNNLIDVTNYVMRTVGHPAHVFDYDRLVNKKLIIRESKKGEEIVTLDDKKHFLPGGDIVADDGIGKIVDLLGIMGTANSVVTDQTRRILFFIDDVEPNHIRRTSMSLGIRTEAAQINEKFPDPEASMDALLYGIELYKEIADGKLLSDIIDIYPNKQKKSTISVDGEKISEVIGVAIPLKKSAGMLTDLGFETRIEGSKIIATPPSYRAAEMSIPEDLIEEIARVYGYHNIPNTLAATTSAMPTQLNTDEFYIEKRIKNALKYWGFTEVYTYSFVSESMYNGDHKNAVKVKNPLTEEFVYMRKSLVPSLLQVLHNNQDHDDISIFEAANVYTSGKEKLPAQRLHLAGAILRDGVTFYHAKGVIEQLCNDLGIDGVEFKKEDGTVFFGIEKKAIGHIVLHDEQTVCFELDLEALLKHVSLKKIYTPISKYPAIVEDLAIVASENVLTGDLLEMIRKQSKLIIDVSLLDKFENTRTFHVVYQSYEKNLTSEDAGTIREKILMTLKDKFGARLKE